MQNTKEIFHLKRTVFSQIRTVNSISRQGFSKPGSQGFWPESFGNGWILRATEISEDCDHILRVLRLDNLEGNTDSRGHFLDDITIVINNAFVDL